MVLPDGYDASSLLRYCNMFKLIWSGKLKQMKARVILNINGIISQIKVYWRAYKTASRPTGLLGLVVLTDG